LLMPLAPPCVVARIASPDGMHELHASAYPTIGMPSPPRLSPASPQCSTPRPIREAALPRPCRRVSALKITHGLGHRIEVQHAPPLSRSACWPPRCRWRLLLRTRYVQYRMKSPSARIGEHKLQPPRNSCRCNQPGICHSLASSANGCGWRMRCGFHGNQERRLLGLGPERAERET
jgi:hypothetical protein